MSIEEFIRDVLKLKGNVLSSGWYRACCPIHGENRPSFGIFTEYPYIYHCFSCGERGNIVNLTSILLKLSTSRAKQLVEDSIEVTLSECVAWEKSPSVGVSDLWVSILSEQLSGSRGIDYCYFRGIPKFVLDVFSVGYDKRDACLKVPLTDVTDTTKVLGFETRGFLTEVIEKHTDITEGLKNRVFVMPRKEFLDVPGVILLEGIFDVFKVFFWLLSSGRIKEYVPIGLSGKVVSKQRVNFVSRFDNICLGFDRDSAGYTAEFYWTKALSPIPVRKLLFDGDDPGESSKFDIVSFI